MKENLFKNLLKILVLLLMIAFIISLMSIAYGSENANFKTNQFSDAISTDVNKLVDDTAGTVIAAMRIISVTIAIVVLLIIAMKYMISAPGDRADIKKHAIAYVVGTFILFGATEIISLLIQVAEKDLPDEG